MQFRPFDLNNPDYVISQKEAINDALIHDPSNADIYIIKACLEMHEGNYEEALKHVNLAIGYHPDRAGYYATLSTILGNMGNREGSGEALKRGYSLSKTVPALNWNYGLWLLQNNNFVEGLDLYRWRKVHLPGHRRLLQPEYERCNDIREKDANKDKTLMVWTEQGIGDQIMFFRFLQAAKDFLGFGRVIFECPQELYTLFANNVYNVDQVYIQSHDFHCPYHFDEHCSLMDLPYYFDISEEKEWYPRSYIKPNPLIVKQWSHGFNTVKGTKIGICWKGSPGHVNDKNRSCNVEHLLPLKECGTLIGLMKNEGEKLPEGMEVFSVREGLINADCTAAAIEHLDCVVTVDTFVAHLAGAMGKKVYLMLPYVHEWRWGVEGRGKSYLYKDVNMYGQSSPGDWDSVVKEIVKDIKTCRDIPLGQQ